MNKEYSIQETTYHNLKEGNYTPVSVEIFDDDGKRGKFSWERIWIDRPLSKGTPIYIVSFKSAGESDARAFLYQDVAEKFLRSLAAAIEQKHGQKVMNYLNNLPLNTSISMKVGTDNFTVTFAKSKI